MTQNQETSELKKLLDGLFWEDKEKLSRHELDLIVQHKDTLSEKLVSILKQKLEVAFSDEWEEAAVSGAFYWSVILLTLLEEKSAFQLMIKLCSLPEEHIEDLLGEDFITEELPFVLALVGQEGWHQLKPIIENKETYLFIRSACLQAMTIMYVRGDVARNDIVAYLQSLLRSCLEDEQCDTEWSAMVVSTCADIWPDECLEDIKELYGVFLVYTRFIGIDDVLWYLGKGKEHCIDEIKVSIEQFTTYYISNNQDVLDDQASLAAQKERDRKFDNYMLYNRKLGRAIDVFLSGKPEGKIGRNDPCFCSSGKKYKKCCLDKKDNYSNFLTETCTITSEPIPSDYTKTEGVF